MSDPTSNVHDDDAPAGDAPYAPPSAGAVLRGAREGAGLSLDAVAQQLKLAPRQVQALEQDDYASLPGRTFVRGFVRNYARYVGLDPDEVVALLPGADVAPSLQRPTITPSSRPMGHMPSAAPPRRTWTRWAIPLALVAIVAAAGVYELRRPQGDARKAPPDAAVRAPAPINSVSVGGTTSATLPNPLTSDTGTAPVAGAPPAAPSPTSSATPPGSTPAAPASTAASGTAANAPAGPSAATPAAAPGVGAPDTVSATSGARPLAASDALLVLTFKASSWVQVKDRNGNVLLGETGQAGMTQAVNGALPLDIVIGNANAVTATFRGQAVDLAPHVRANVARLSLK